MPVLTIPQAFELAVQYHQKGYLKEAEAIYRQIIAAQPNHAEALHLSGVIASQFGDNGAALDLVRQAITLRPDWAEAHISLGNALMAIGKINEAIFAYRRAIAIRPDLPEAHNNLGNALKEIDRLEDAIQAYRQAIALRPAFPEAVNNLGVALTANRQFPEAILTCRQAIALRPELAEAYSNLGNSLALAGQPNEAAEACRRAIDLKPRLADAYNNLGNALRELKKLDEAITAYKQATALRNRYPEANLNLANALAEAERLDEAIATYRQAITLKPDYVEAHSNLGSALKDMGLLDEAVAAQRQALILRPARADIHSNLLYTLNFHSGYSAREIAEERYIWDVQHAEPLISPIRSYTNALTPERRLRVGYVSSNFQDHVVGRNLLPLFKHHDRRQVEITCYSDVAVPDDMTRVFKNHSNRWHDLIGLSDNQVAELVRADHIDVLIDLTQHMAYNRLLVFARQPAPIQMSFAGYPESAGMKAVPYRISDRWLEVSGPPTSERIAIKDNGHEQVYLIDSFWCYSPCGMEVQCNELPAQNAGMITFGCLNNFCKVNEPLLRLWARILKVVKDSRLIIMSHEGSHRQRTLQLFEHGGVDASRIEFVTPRPQKEYLELYHRLDIVLDTFPYNGHTTSLDALWMGIPVVSLCGDRAVSRAGLSQLNNLGLPELVAFNEDQYAEIATTIAEDIPRLKELRANLRHRMEKSILMDGPHFARQIEFCYRSMWRQWCDSQKFTAR